MAQSSTRHRGFSLVEMLVATAISSTLLVSALVALDSMFKGYKETTESASTHAVTRIVVNRMLSLIRTGSDFGPFPVDVLDNESNPVFANYFEFSSEFDDDGIATEVTRIEFRLPGEEAQLQSWGPTDSPPAQLTFEGGEAAEHGELWYVLIDVSEEDPVIEQEHQLLPGVRSAVFTLEYDIGPRLTRGTIDLIVEPNDSIDLTVSAESAPQTIRLVASAMPRQSLE